MSVCVGGGASGDEGERGEEAGSDGGGGGGGRGGGGHRPLRRRGRQRDTIQPQESPARMGREADPVLAVQAPRSQHQLSLRDMREPDLQGTQGIPETFLVWQNLREKKELTKFKPELEEEYEDSQGNVVTKKIFEDLKRQGLL